MKGPKNAWREREQKRKHVSKISTLKKYAKLVKKEGFVSDRVRIDGVDRTENPDKQKKIQQVSPMRRQKETVNPREVEREERNKAIELREQEKREKLKQRKEKAKIMTQRTSKGQPVMAGRIKSILGKLMNEN